MHCNIGLYLVSYALVCFYALDIMPLFTPQRAVYNQALSEGDHSGHMAGAPSIWGPQIVLDLTLDILEFLLSRSSNKKRL